MEGTVTRLSAMDWGFKTSKAQTLSNASSGVSRREKHSFASNGFKEIQITLATQRPWTHKEAKGDFQVIHQKKRRQWGLLLDCQTKRRSQVPLLKFWIKASPRRAHASSSRLMLMKLNFGTAVIGSSNTSIPVSLGSKEAARNQGHEHWFDTGVIQDTPSSSHSESRKQAQGRAWMEIGNADERGRDSSGGTGICSISECTCCHSDWVHWKVLAAARAKPCMTCH